MRKQSGRMAPLAMAAIVLGIVAVVLVIFFSRSASESAAASEFMSALAKADVDKLAELSYMDGETPESIKAKWTKTMAHSKHYLFLWSIKRSELKGQSEATVTLGFFKDARSSSAYEEKFELPMQLVEGKWKVDVRGISREMFPSLPH